MYCEATGQSFGGFGLYSPSGKNKDYTGEFIWKILKASGVDELSEMAGKTIRIKSTRRNIESIGHILNDDMWFTPSEDFKLED